MSKFVAPFVRSAYNYDTALVSDETGLRCEDPSLTQQQFKDDSNPNFIMEMFARDPNSAESLLRSKPQPVYGDFVDAVDYKTAKDRVADANSSFNSLPARLRTRFDNDPAKLLDFIHDEKNHAEAFELGLVKAPPKAPSEPLEPVASKPAKGAKGEPAAD